eukprot:TRINITY_DN6682_c0_g1_i1.p1 TRINITY_DN6682_c0_g1~~TRINITY_DN6682_c0_g1_i1.p1  ORF type:complete len:413 (-),score=130.57 TRINITY_DN6682_c0_g1_i1:76-1314(-)
MESKQKSLKYVQKARKELMMQEEKIKMLEEELSVVQSTITEKENLLADKDVAIEKLKERVTSLEDTLALFYHAIEKDEERVSKEHKPFHHGGHHSIATSTGGREQLSSGTKYPLPTEPDQRKQIFEEDMKLWRLKESKRKREAPSYVSVPSSKQQQQQPPSSSSLLPQQQKPKEQQKPVVRESQNERPNKVQRIAVVHQDSLTTSSPILQRKVVAPTKTVVVTEDTSNVVLTIAPSTAAASLTSSPAAKAVMKQVTTTPLQQKRTASTDSPNRQPLAPLQRNVSNRTNVELNNKGTPPTAKKQLAAINGNNGGSKGLGLFGWCKQTAAPHPIKDFTKSWSDGLALCTLLNNVRPGCIQPDSLDPNDPLHNISLALDTAEKLGVTKLVDAEDFGKERNSMMTYLSQLYRVLQA